MFKRVFSILLVIVISYSFLANADDTTIGEAVITENNVGYNAIYNGADYNKASVASVDRTLPIDEKGAMTINVTSGGNSIQNLCSDLNVTGLNVITWYSEPKGSWVFKVFITVSNTSANNIEISNKAIEVYNNDFSKQFSLMAVNLYTSPLVIPAGGDGCFYTNAPIPMLDFTEQDLTNGYNIKVSWDEVDSKVFASKLNCVVGDITMPTNKKEEVSTNLKVYNSIDKDIDYVSTYCVWYGLNENNELVIKDICSEDFQNFMIGGVSEMTKYFTSPITPVFEDASQAPVKVECNSYGTVVKGRLLG